MTQNMNQILKDVSDFFSNRIKQYGATPQGVDWKDAASQDLGFLQLLQVIQQEPFVLNELGCGYGKLSEILEQSHSDYVYRGYDISADMIAAANQNIQDSRVSFIHMGPQDELEKADYTLANGIFNLKLHYSDSEWEGFIYETLHKMDRSAEKGFAFNMLTSYSDPEYMRSDLYYASASHFFDYCMRHFSRRVQLKHDYPLYEFTLLVFKNVD